MRSLKLKTTCRGNHVHTTLANPLAPIGDNHDASVQTRQINNIPDGVNNELVIRLFSGTCDMSSFFNRRLEFDFSELGIGYIVR